MAKITFKGLEEYTAKLNRLEALSRDKIIGAAVYDGARIVADEVRAQLQAVPTDEGHYKGEGQKKIGPSAADKQAIMQGMGIAPLQYDDGFENVKVGFDGYDDRPTERYPRGHPIPMLARAVQSGTSWMHPNPFVKTAVRRARKPAVEAMKKRVEQEIDQIMKG